MNVCVYCGSSSGRSPVIIEKCRLFARLIGQSGFNLVYGGSSLGIMGTMADTVMLHGGKVKGVIPENFFASEVAHQDIDDLILVKDMHQRKQRMAELADCFVALPGGFGTLEELFEIITWNQLSIIKKPVFLLNIEKYFDSLIKMLDVAVNTGFIKPDNHSILQVTSNPEECITMIKDYLYI
ncbi:MAG TPA: TIGR00730 family Rossman fold protein [Balneolaceae bacterium]|nr:TIGR00730 family Rossman fold protein [Balneolaceae bacterium]